MKIARNLPVSGRSDEWWNVPTSEFRRGDENRPKPRILASTPMNGNASRLPPQSRFGPIGEEERKQVYLMNNLYLRYQNAVDADSAYEFLTRRSEALALEQQQEQQRLAQEKAAQKQRQAEEKEAQRQAERKAREEQKEKERQQRAIRSGVRSVGNSVVGTVGREVGKNLGGSIGGSFGKRLGGNLGASLGRSILGTFLKR